MGLIKSALELAMERTVGLEVDREALREKEVHQQGRLLLVKALTEGQEFLAEELTKRAGELSKKELLLLKQGGAEALLSRLTLNLGTEPELEFSLSKPLLLVLTQDKGSEELDKILLLLQQFGQEVAQLKSAIEKQVGPQLRQRAEEYARQAGVQVRFILEKDPAYVKILTQNMAPLKTQYQEALDGLKSLIQNLIH